MNPFIVPKNYKTKLSVIEVTDIISTKLKEEVGLFKSKKYFGKIEESSFKFILFSRNIIRIKIMCTFYEVENKTLLKVIYKPTPNPIFLMLPAVLFFSLGFFIKNFTLNGERISYLEQILLLSIFLFVPIIGLTIASFGALRSSIQDLESDLKLKLI